MSHSLRPRKEKMASGGDDVEWSRESRYTCSICLDPFRFPKLLPCGHTFCHKCLISMVDHFRLTYVRDFACPICRTAAPNVRLPDDISKLPSNFYITHADIERSLLVVNKNCSQHAESSLKYLCIDCDAFVCENCKLAAHMDHKTKDLTVTGQNKGTVDGKENAGGGDSAGGSGGGGSGELKAKNESAVEEVTKKLKATIAACRKEQRKIKDKREIIEKQVRSQVQLITEIAKRASTLALGKLINLNRREQNKLQARIDRMEQQVADLKKKGEVTPTDLLVAQEVAKTRVPAVKHLILKTQRRHLAGFRSVADFVGYPAVLAVKGDRLAPIMTLKKLFRVGEEDQGQGVQRSAMIRALCPVDKDDVVWVLYEMSTAKGRGVCYEACYTQKGKLVSKEPSKPDHALGIDHGHLHRQYARYNTIYLLRSYCLYSLGVNHSRKDCVVWKRGPKPGMHFEKGMTFLNRCPESFTASPNGEVFALVDKLHSLDKLPGNAKPPIRPRRKDVMLFHAGSNHPFAVYHPPEGKIYSPTDICFFPIRGTCMLLVADWMSDSVHVVRVGENEVTFVRYLDTGRNDIVKPVALIPDSRGRLLIGCEDGQVLLCSPN